MQDVYKPVHLGVRVYLELQIARTGEAVVIQLKHGGPQGFDRVIWQARPFHGGDSAGVVLSYTSPDRPARNRVAAVLEAG